MARDSEDRHVLRRNRVHTSSNTSVDPPVVEAPWRHVFCRGVLLAFLLVGSIDTTVFAQDRPDSPADRRTKAFVDPFICGSERQFGGKVEFASAQAIASAYTDPLVARKYMDDLRLIIGVTPSDVAAVHIEMGSLYKRNGVLISTATLLDDGSQGDQIAGDGLFTIDGLSIDYARVGMDDQPIGKIYTATRQVVLEYEDGGLDTLNTMLFLRFAFVDPTVVPPSRPQEVAPGVYATEYTVQFVEEPGPDGWQLSTANVARDFYELTDDDGFDFLVMNSLSLIAAPFAGLYSSVSNDANGIGRPIYSSASNYGSAGRLQGLIQIANFSLNPALLNHEILHRWAVFLDTDLNLGASHWGVVERDTPGGFGSFFGAVKEIVDQGPGTYRAYLHPFELTGWAYSDLELYLMGLLPPDEVETPITVLVQPTDATIAPDLSYKEYHAQGIRQVQMSEIIASMGERSPGPGSSQAEFHLANLVVHGRPLSPTEFSFFDYLMQNYESAESLTSELGLSFQESANDRASIETRIVDCHGDVMGPLANVCTAPEAVLPLLPENAAKGVATNPTFEWQSFEGVESYRLQLSIDSTFAETPLVDSTLSATALSLVEPLAHDVTYYWHVRAKNTIGWGAWSQTQSFTTIVDVPGAVTLLSPESGAIEVAAYTTYSWQPVDVAAAYHLQVGVNEALTSLVVDDSTLIVTAFIASEPLMYSTTYYWRVRAAVDDGLGKTTGLLFGPWSETHSFTVAVGTATETEPDIPTSFALHPNYPNPFNPSTTIQYDVPEAGEIRLTVLDALGRVVQVLSTKYQVPGSYSTTWEPHHVPSGVYFVRMQAGSFHAMRSVILTQ